ncbi:DUF386 family protein [Pedobacter sp. HMF7647]|uniref:DUF386 family protein n=1 Tax=Hufsiella arboris TaxID=2695275 RepID=A0A7K1YF58_9SPHI|nr:YhcH/YjgK/YiaL family protein [Hufsiella arboris]MXV52688.1 DUF386 family protein [Hufsiella arboris]
MRNKTPVSDAKKWVKSRKWSNGCKLNPHQSVNASEFYYQYHANKAVWDKVFTFIKDHNLDSLPAGKYPVDSTNTYASITEGPSKEPSQAKWESHKKYIDLQYVIKGKESIGVLDVDKASVEKPYDETKDVANYSSDGGTYYEASAAAFFLFFPQNAHRPSIKVDGFDVVKKLVIKIKVAE